MISEFDASIPKINTGIYSGKVIKDIIELPLLKPSTKAEVTAPIIHKIGVPIIRDIKTFIIFSVCKLKSKSSKGDKKIIGKQVMIQIDKDLDKKIISKGIPDM